jgi:O-antigen ligase
MTTTAVAPRRSTLSAWCGWVLIGTFALLPLVGWAVPMGFAELVGLAGLLSLPALRISDEDRPVLVLLLVLLVWAAMSSAWSPYRPTKPDHMTALKLALQLPLYWAVVCAARRIDPRLREPALATLAWAGAVFGALLVMETATDARVLEALHLRFIGPIRHDISEVHIGHSSFALALVFPLAMAAALRRRRLHWLALPAGAGALAAAIRFGSDAPVLAVILAAIVGLAAWRWSRATPRALGWAAAIYVLAAPAIVWAVRATGHYEGLQHALPQSWSDRMGYWSHAVDWIKDHPIRGWGLDASRMFGPGIILHPHDDALQLWLELGAVGALIGAAFFWVAIRRAARPVSDLGMAGVTAAAAVYLLFGALNFGAWQEWWLALGALIPVTAALLSAPETST